MIDPQTCAAMLHAIPGTSERWEASRRFWDGDEPGICNECSEIARHVCDLVAQGRLAELAELFALFERLMTEGDEGCRRPSPPASSRTC
jgi:hypothetical protein